MCYCWSRAGGGYLFALYKRKTEYHNITVKIWYRLPTKWNTRYFFFSFCVHLLYYFMYENRPLKYSFKLSRKMKHTFNIGVGCFQSCKLSMKQKMIKKKHRENRKMLLREHPIGLQGVKMFLLKDTFKVYSS